MRDRLLWEMGLTTARSRVVRARVALDEAVAEMDEAMRAIDALTDAELERKPA